MKNKKIYGFLLLALIIMLLPIGMVSAKYRQTKDVGTVTLDITPPILSPTWFAKNSSDVTISELIVDSFTPEADPNRYSSFSWDDGKPVGYDSDDNNNFKNNVRLFEKENGDGTYTTYILAIGKNPVIFPENSNSLFAGWKGTNVTEKITFNNIDTSTVNDMQWMFYYCGSLTSLDISSFKTDKVTHMNNMFAGCSNMTSLTLGVNFNTSNVINMADMFNGCSSLTNLDVKQFDTSKVTDMTQMFNSCNALTSLNINSFDTSNVTKMKNMFGSCNALTALDLSNFTTPYLIDMNNMFYDCNGLVSLDLSNFSTSDSTNMSNLFTKCSQLKQVTLGGNFKFNNISDTTTLLPDQKGNIQNADGYWYTTSGEKLNSTQAAVYHNEHNTITTYYAVQSEAPSSVNTFSLLTENGIISGAIQGN